jgi:hypothetical protein
MKDFMINVTDVVLHVAKPHVLRAEHKRSNADFEFVKEVIAIQIQKAQSTDEILGYAYDMVKNEQRMASNDIRNSHIDRNEKLIGRMKEFLIHNLRSDAIMIRELLLEAFCDIDDYKEVMKNIGHYTNDIKTVTVIDEALRDLEKEGKIKKVKFVDHVNHDRIKTGYMLTEDDI